MTNLHLRHELRSPLHGVMAAAELLQGTEFDDFQGSLLETINACGRTLLDTMNQVLDYTKLVSLEKDLRHLKKNLAPHMDIQSMQRSAGHLDTYMTTDVSLLSEEVVEGVSLGHSYSQRPIAPTDPTGAALTKTKNPEGFNIPRLHVDVIIDIQPNDWFYYTPPGALRRIIMNIFSNAVKYTDSGHVSLHLEAKEAPESFSQPQGMKEDLITLTVSDTGRGMSADFLRGRLFVPFAQENSLSVGTGLGLSIVRSLVRSLGGSINVDSRPDEGTTVKVVLPLTRQKHEDYTEISGGIPSPPQEEADSITNEVRLLRDNHAGRKVAILGVGPDDAPNHPLWGPVSRYLTCWYGLELVSSSSRAPVDIILAEEIPAEEDKNWSFSGPQQAVLVLSSKYVGHNTVQAKFSSFAKVVSIVSRPCGPHKLARFIQKCFEQAASSSLPDPVITSKQDRGVPSTSIEVSSAGDMAQNDHAETSHLNDIPCDSPTPPPSVRTEPPESAPVPSSTETAELPPKPSTPRVLVVEDNKINLNLMLAFLKKRKLDTLHSAENGKLAVDAFKKAPQGYDIIFMGKLLYRSHPFDK
jgi:signal transduction histidine kinase